MALDRFICCGHYSSSRIVSNGSYPGWLVGGCGELITCRAVDDASTSQHHWDMIIPFAVTVSLRWTSIVNSNRSYLFMNGLRIRTFRVLLSTLLQLFRSTAPGDSTSRYLPWCFYTVRHNRSPLKHATKYTCHRSLSQKNTFSANEHAVTPRIYE